MVNSFKPVIGALRNPWRCAMIGGVLGAAACSGPSQAEHDYEAGVAAAVGDAAAPTATPGQARPRLAGTGSFEPPPWGLWRASFSAALGKEKRLVLADAAGPVAPADDCLLDEVAAPRRTVEGRDQAGALQFRVTVAYALIDLRRLDDQSYWAPDTPGPCPAVVLDDSAYRFDRMTLHFPSAPLAHAWDRKVLTAALGPVLGENPGPALDAAIHELETCADSTAVVDGRYTELIVPGHANWLPWRVVRFDGAPELWALSERSLVK